MHRTAASLLIASMLVTSPLLAGSVDVAAAQERSRISDITGRWRTVMHGALVDISDCGDGTPCGRLVWVDGAISDGAVADARNPDRALRARPLIGTPILWGFRHGSEGWESGRLYNPQTGQTFRSSLRAVSRGGLRVTGCLGPLCRSQVWRRADDDREGPRS
jgi:uncharacterized protein (DUF2147 family)